jgi:succinate dehydrogenase/fumarate reductase flavoprotein subunit
MMVRPRFGDRFGGSAVIEAVHRQASREGIAERPRVMITDLLRRDGRIAGALGLERSTGRPIACAARAVLLATADCSFRGNYVCTDATTGDGFRLAYDQGLRLSNMEFLVTNTGSPHFGFEGTGVALRWGGRILNARGESFMQDYHRDADAAEINVLTEAMAREVRKGHGPPFYLEMGDAWKERIGPALAAIGGFMPLNLTKLEAEGVDLSQRQEWIPAVQGLRGGVRTEPGGQSDLPGLFAAGTTESLDPGLFKGWSTMRAMGSGERSGRGAAAYLRRADPISLDAGELAELAARATSPLGRSGPGTPRPEEVIERTQGLIFRPEVSILKRDEDLRRALAEIEDLRDAALPSLAARDPHELVKLHEARNMICAAEMYLRASLTRTESRGSHFRDDHPERDDENWLAWVNLRRSDHGEMIVETEPVPLGSYPIQPRPEETRA